MRNLTALLLGLILASSMLAQGGMQPGPGTPRSASAGIAFDAATDGGNNGGSTSTQSFSHTCSGSNRILFVGIVGDVIPGADDVSSVTYNGVGMTLVDKYTSATSNARFTYLYMLVAPTTGSNTVAITFATTHFIFGGAVSYTGAKQTGQPDASAKSNAGSNVSSWATSVTTVANNSWAVLMENGYDANNAPAAGAGSTRRTFDPAFGGWGLFDSNGPKTPAGLYSMTTTYPGSPTAYITHVMASIAPL